MKTDPSSGCPVHPPEVSDNPSEEDEMADKYMYHSPDRVDIMCAICNHPLKTRWTDTHGIGACLTCGATYRLFHYEDGKPVDKDPTLTFYPEWVPLVKRYWEEAHRNVAPGAYNMGRRSSYEVATDEDFNSWVSWCEENKDNLPKAEEAL